MTWAKIDDRLNDDPRLLQLERGVRLLHIEGLVWSCRHLTDGAMPRYALGKITDEPDPAAAVAKLVAVGLWAETPTGWEIVDFLDDQSSAADVERMRVLARERQRRQRLHKAGDHSECTDPRYCRYVTRDTSGDLRRESRHPTLSSPTRPHREGKEKREGDAPLGIAPDGRPSLATPHAVTVRFDNGTQP